MSNTKNVMSQAANAYDGPTYVSDVFQAHHYIGNGYNDRRFVNGINLKEYGGMFLAKQKNSNDFNRIWDSVTGLQRHRITSSSNADAVITQGYGAVNDLQFHTDGFTLSNNVYFNQLGSGNEYANWIWRRSPGFFDIVEYVGDNENSQTIPHNLQCKPGMIWVKAIDDNENWQIYHSAQPNNPRQYHYVMTSSQVVGPNAYIWNNTDPDENNFYVGWNSTDLNVNERGKRYIAYLWAEGSDAGAYRFGENEDEHIIRCGAYIGTTVGGAEVEVNLGFQPQAVIFKNNNNSAHWHIQDELMGQGNGFTHRDFSNTNQLSTNDQLVSTTTGGVVITPNGFKIVADDSTNTLWNQNGSYFIYCAIRRDDMKTPKSGTEVFKSFRGGNEDPIEVGFAPDWGMWKDTNANGTQFYSTVRIFGHSKFLRTDSDVALGSQGDLGWDSSTTVSRNSTPNSEYITYLFKRARGFMDIQTYTGDGNVQTNVQHNLGVKPELVWVKQVNGTGAWVMAGEAIDKIAAINSPVHENFGRFFTATNAGYTGSTDYREEVDTATTFGIKHNNTSWNTTNEEYIAWLFASVPGVCKIGSYNHAGGELTVDCGFTTGARFILVKKFYSNGPWYIFDTANGIGVNQSRMMEMDDTVAALANPATIKPHPSGFTVLNNGYISNSTYLYMAIS